MCFILKGIVGKCGKETLPLCRGRFGEWDVRKQEEKCVSLWSLEVKFTKTI